MYAWNEEKNELLKKKRGISFDQIVDAIENKDGLITVTHHYNQTRYPGQRIFIVRIDDYCCLVPFIEDNEKVFLKTIFRSRKATKKYLGKK